MNWTTLFKKFTNWKYFIWLLAVVFLSISSYTNAWTLTNCSTSITDNGDWDFSYNYNWCNPSYIPLSSLPFDENWDLEITASSNLGEYWICYFDENQLPEGASVSSESCSLYIWLYACNQGYEDENWNYQPCEPSQTFYLTETDDIIIDSINRDNYPNWIYVHIDNADFSKSYYPEDSDDEEKITYLPNLSTNIIFEWTVEPDEPDEPWTWWNENTPINPDNPEEWWNTGWLVVWWTTNFAPIITQLGNIAGEFIPYMIYIAIACLWIAIVYRAIKYILWYLQNKSKGAIWREWMKERRRRRRRNRRFIRSVKNQTYQK
jgi:hypothetical protein